MERQQIQQRDNFSDEERHDIYLKSNGYCAHCGKRIEFGGQATIDHFVPLSKGGVNRDYNMVMLCYNCNQSKGNYIHDPKGYLPYLNESEMKKINDYYMSYVQSFDFLTTHNILATDILYYQLIPENARRLVENNKPGKIIHKGRHKSTMPIAETVRLVRAETKDREKLIKFYHNYFKKYKREDLSPEEMTDFWFKYGTIYYYEQIDGIKMIFPIMIGYIDGQTIGLNIFVHALYANTRYLCTASQILEDIAFRFATEQNLPFMPCLCTTLAEDPIKTIFLLQEYGYSVRNSRLSDKFTSAYYTVHLSRQGIWSEMEEEQKDKEMDMTTQALTKYLVETQELDDYILNHPGITPLRHIMTYINTNFSDVLS